MTEQIEPGTPCKYSARHDGSWDEVPATTIIDCGTVVGKIPACARCAELYEKFSKR